MKTYTTNSIRIVKRRSEGSQSPIPVTPKQRPHRWNWTPVDFAPVGYYVVGLIDSDTKDEMIDRIHRWLVPAGCEKPSDKSVYDHSVPISDIPWLLGRFFGSGDISVGCDYRGLEYFMVSLVNQGNGATLEAIYKEKNVYKLVVTVDAVKNQNIIQKQMERMLELLLDSPSNGNQK